MSFTVVQFSDPWLSVIDPVIKFALFWQDLHRSVGAERKVRKWFLIECALGQKCRRVGDRYSLRAIELRVYVYIVFWRRLMEGGRGTRWTCSRNRWIDVSHDVTRSFSLSVFGLSLRSHRWVFRVLRIGKSPRYYVEIAFWTEREFNIFAAETLRWSLSFSFTAFTVTQRERLIFKVHSHK